MRTLNKGMSELQSLGDVEGASTLSDVRGFGDGQTVFGRKARGHRADGILRPEPGEKDAKK